MSEFLLFDIFLEYQIAETTVLNVETFLATTKELLEEAEYTIKINSPNKIIFNGFASKNDLSRITDGNFEIVHGQNGNDVILTYQQSLTMPMIIIIIFSTMGFFSSPGMMIVVVPFGLQELIRANKLSKTAERILSVVADPT